MKKFRGDQLVIDWWNDERYKNRELRSLKPKKRFSLYGNEQQKANSEKSTKRKVK